MAASPCLKAFMVPGGPIFPFSPAISFCPRCRDSFSALVLLWQSNGKVKKILCVLQRLDALRGLLIILASGCHLRYRSLLGIVTPTLAVHGAPFAIQGEQ